MLRPRPIRALAVAALLAGSADVSAAQQPTDLNTLVAPIADAISRSGKHKVLVLPLRGPDDKYPDLGAALARQISARLAATVPGFQEIVATHPDPSGQSGQPCVDWARAYEIGRRSGAEIVI